MIVWSDDGGGTGAENGGDDAQDDAEEQCPPEAIYLEARDDFADKYDDQGIDHEQEKAKGHNRYRDCEEYQDWPQKGVDDGQGDGYHQGGGKFVHGDSRQQPGSQQYGAGVNQQSKYDFHISVIWITKIDYCLQVFKCSGVQVFGCSGVQVFGCSGVRKYI